MRRAKILATLGPASREPGVLESLLAAGANAARINMSHGSQEEHSETIARARAAAEKMGRPLAVLVDLSGPKIRTGVLKGGQPVPLEPDAQFTLTTRSVAGDDSIPQTFVLDRRGRLVRHFVGFDAEVAAELERAVTEALAEQAD